MIRFDIVTIFPDIFNSYFNESIIRRAQEKKLIEISVHNLRDFTDDKHKIVDDKPYGGGAGMIFKVDPIYKAVQKIRSTKSEARNKKNKFLASESKIQNSKFKTRVILFSAKRKLFAQADARRLSKYDQLILICGRYEGVDERVAEHIADEEVSVGKYVLTGGEIPAMIVVDAVARLVPGVIKSESLAEESFNKLVSSREKPAFAKASAGAPLCQQSEYPQYTRPENFKGWKVPKVLLSGNHQAIEDWRKKKSKAC